VKRGDVAFPASAPVDRVAELVRGRIREGAWTAENFPSAREIRELCGVHPAAVAEAMRVLEQEGLVHLVKELRPPSRGRTLVWRPVDAHVNDQTDYTARLRRQILSGALSGVLPEKEIVARQYKVHVQIIENSYWQLAGEGLACPVWLRGVRSRVWYVPPNPPRIDRSQDRRSRVETIADDVVLLVSRLRGVDKKGNVFERPVPSAAALAAHYRASRQQVIPDVLELLVARRVLLPSPRDDRSTAYELAPWPPSKPWPPPDLLSAGNSRGVQLKPALRLRRLPEGTPLDSTVAWPPADQEHGDG